MIELIVSCFILGFVLEYIDSTLGGGYGTVLTPLFLAFGYPIHIVVPMILLSEIFTGASSAFFHHGYGNVEPKVLVYKLPFCIIGVIAGVFLAVNLSKTLIKTYIGILVLGMGIFMLLRHWKGKKKEKIMWKRVSALGSLIGFNKAISGGGFGPLSVSGLSWAGFNPKRAVGSTQLTESIVCVASLALYMITKYVEWNWTITIPLIIGAVLSTFPAAYTTHRLPAKHFALIVAVFIIILGVNVLRSVWI